MESRLVKVALRFLRWFCPEFLLESIEGDLWENYNKNLNEKGARLAQWYFFYQIVRFFRWEIISRNKFNFMFFNSGLFFSHIKIALRNYRRHFGYSFINVMGLAAGIGVCLIIYSYTRYELNYDAFYRDGDRMYRVNQTNIWTPAGGMFANTTPPLANQLKENLPEIIEATRINTPGNYEVRYKDQTGDLIIFRESKVLAADSNFFDFFTIPVLEGDPQKMLVGKNRVVITESTSERYFGTGSPLGKVLLLGDDRIPVIVSGLVADLPENMHFDFDLLLSMSTNPAVKDFDWSWIWSQMATYVKLRDGKDLEKISQKMTEILMPQVRSTFDRLGMDFEDFMQGKGDWVFELQPVQDIHLHSADIGNRLGPVGDIKTIRILQIMAILILLIAVINFVNLSTARANIRAKEIGVKKTLGATIRELARQFQVESIFMTFIASVLSIPLALALSAFIFNRTGININFDWLRQPDDFLFLVITLLLIGLLAGIYPSLYLTRLKPVTVMASQKGDRKGNLGLRNLLVAFQFTISLALLSGGILIAKQLNYLNEKDLGFEKENILVVDGAEILGDQVYTLRNQIENMPEVESASVSMSVPGEMSFEDLFQREGSNIKLAISQVKVDPHFLTTMNLKMAAGRFFQENNEADKYHAVINETTARLFGWTPEEALGEKIVYPSDGVPSSEIIGVVSDFHFQSLYQNINPLLLVHIESPMWGDQKMLAVKYRQATVEETLAGVKGAWEQFAHESPFSYSILDEDLNRLYEQDKQLSILVNMLSLLSVFIAILGLTGLVSFTVDQRKKEIGIRKVLGASSGGIFLLINRQYLNLFFIGLLCSVPLTWWVLSIWLRDFAYHIDITWYTFLFSGIILLLICLFSVGILVIRAARSNPVEAIRDN